MVIEGRIEKAGTVIAEEYILKALIAVGSTSKVWLAHDQTKGEVAAIKIYNSRDHNETAYRVSLLSDILRASTSNTARLFPEVIGRSTCFDRQCLIYNVYGMSLRSLLLRLHPGRIPPPQVRWIMWQVFEGLEFLHAISIAHTDIKPDNILLREDDFVRIIEMNSSGNFIEKSIVRNPQIVIADLDDALHVDRPQRFITGTKGYRAPEVHGGIGWGIELDIFSAGCLLYELYIGRPLLPATADVFLLFAVMEKSLGNFEKVFADRYMKTNPNLFTRTIPRRVNFPSTTAHNFLDTIPLEKASQISTQIPRPDLCDLLKSTLKLNPAKRLTAINCRGHRYFGVKSSISV